MTVQKGSFSFSQATAYEQAQRQPTGTQLLGVAYAIADGLYAYQYADGHVIGSNTDPDSFTNSDSAGVLPTCVGQGFA